MKLHTIKSVKIVVIASSKKYNYNIFWSGKSGCTLLRRLFLFLHKEELSKKIPQDYNEIDKDFMFDPELGRSLMLTRNPYTRAVSMFTNKMCGRWDHRTLHLKIPQFSKKVSFEKFLIFLRENKDCLREVDVHLMRQVDSLLINRKNNTSYPLDRICLVKLENFNEDILKFYKSLGSEELTLKVQDFLGQMNKICINKTPRVESQDFVGSKEYDVETFEFPDYKFFYNESLLDLVYEIYEEDFKLGYDRNFI